MTHSANPPSREFIADTERGGPLALIFLNVTDEETMLLGHMPRQNIMKEDVIRLFGDLDDRAVVEILAIGASWEQLEEAAMWNENEDDIMAASRRPLVGAPAKVYEILSREQQRSDDERRP